MNPEDPFDAELVETDVRHWVCVLFTDCDTPWWLPYLDDELADVRA